MQQQGTALTAVKCGRVVLPIYGRVGEYSLEANYRVISDYIRLHKLCPWD
jgi:hypothetical protein